MTGDDALLGVVQRLQQRVRALELERVAQPQWAIVTGVDPLQIRLDGFADPLNAPPITLVAGLEVDDWVRVAFEGKRPIIRGRLGGSPVDTATATSGIFTVTDSDFDLLGATVTRYGPVVDLVIRLEYTGADVTSDGSGNIPDRTIGTLAQQYRPADDRFVLMVREGYFRLDASVEADGDVRLRDGSYPSHLGLSSGYIYSIHSTHIIPLS